MKLFLEMSKGAGHVVNITYWSDSAPCKGLLTIKVAENYSVEKTVVVTSTQKNEQIDLVINCGCTPEYIVRVEVTLTCDLTPEPAVEIQRLRV